MADQLSVAQKGGRAVVVGVEEGYEKLACLALPWTKEVRTQWLLLQEEEASVNQFEELGEIIELEGN